MHGKRSGGRRPVVLLAEFTCNTHVQKASRLVRGTLNAGAAVLFSRWFYFNAPSFISRVYLQYARTRESTQSELCFVLSL